MARDRDLRLQSTQVVKLLSSQLEDLRADCVRLRSRVEMTVDMFKMMLDLENGEISPPVPKPPDNSRSPRHRNRDEETDGNEGQSGGLPEELEPSTKDDLSMGRGALLKVTRMPDLSIQHLDDKGEYNVADASQVLGLSTHTIRLKCREGALQFTKVKGRGGTGGGEYRFSGAELKRYHAE